MKNSTLGELEVLLEQVGCSIQQIEKIYPKLYDPIMNLSITGVSPRNYFHWKKSGLLSNFSTNEEERGWVKINLIEYVWIKLIETMREFGVPFEKIKETKDLMFSNFVKYIIDDREGYLQFLRENSPYTKEKIKLIDKAISIAQKEFENSPEEYQIYHTLLGNLIMELLLKNDKGYITISKKEKEYEINYFTIKSLADLKELIQPLFDVPCLHIPIRSMLEEFLENDKSEKYIDTISLLNLKEMKVIEAIRKKDFKEIVIKQDGKKEDIIIEIEKDGSILDQKAKEIKRILGLNEYSEVTIKFRNDKNLYFKNKTRL
jgi:hypothetical protein